MEWHINGILALSGKHTFIKMQIANWLKGWQGWNMGRRKDDTG